MKAACGFTKLGGNRRTAHQSACHGVDHILLNKLKKACIMSKRLLVTDDALIIREIIKDAAQSAGWEIAGEASNGQMAVEKYQELHPDVCTIDLVMPEYDGLHGVRGIKAVDPDAKVVVVGASIRRTCSRRPSSWASAISSSNRSTKHRSSIPSNNSSPTRVDTEQNRCSNLAPGEYTGGFVDEPFDRLSGPLVNYEFNQSSKRKSGMFRKSLVLLVTSVRSCTNATEAIIKSTGLASSPRRRISTLVFRISSRIS